MLIYQFYTIKNVFIFLSLSLWVPQIIHNVMKDVKDGLHPVYLIGTSLTRLAIPLYFFSCPVVIIGPMFDYSGDNAFSVVLVCWMTFQASILLLQRRYHARFFIPAKYLPHKYDYRRLGMFLLLCINIALIICD